MTNDRMRERVKSAIRQLEEVLAALDGRPVSASTATDAESDFDEVISSGEAAMLARVSKDLIQRWCREKGIGRKKGGEWEVSVIRLRHHIGLE